MKKLVFKTYLLTTIVLLLLLTVQFTVLADSGENEYSKTVRGYLVSVIFEKPAAVGEIPIHIQIYDAVGIPVSNAEVQVSLVGGEASHIEGETITSLHGEIPGESEISEHSHTAASETHAEISGNSDISELPHEASSDTHAEMSGNSDVAEHPHEASSDTHADMSGNSDASVHPHSAPSDAHDEMEMVKLEESHQSGDYTGEIAINSAGDWTILVHMTIQGEFIEVDFPLSIARSQSSLGILASFFALNTVIILAAIVLKPKSKSTLSLTEV